MLDPVRVRLPAATISLRMSAPIDGEIAQHRHRFIGPHRETAACDREIAGPDDRSDAHRLRPPSCIEIEIAPVVVTEGPPKVTVPLGTVPNVGDVEKPDPGCTVREVRGVIASDRS